MKTLQQQRKLAAKLLAVRAVEDWCDFCEIHPNKALQIAEQTGLSVKEILQLRDILDAANRVLKSHEDPYLEHWMRVFSERPITV